MPVFTAVHSSVARLAAKLAPRPTPSSTTLTNSTQLRKPKSHKGLVKLKAIRTRHAVLGRIRGMGLGVLGKAKKLWTKPALRHTTSVGTIDEVARIPHTVVIEALETRSGVVQHRTRVYTYWDVDPDAPDTTYELYNAESQDELRRENEADATASVFSEDSGFDQYLNDILEEIAESENEWRDGYEWGDSDTEFEAIPDVADDDSHALNHLEAEDEVGISSSSNQCHSATDTAPSQISIFFCPPTSSTLVPLTTSDDESASGTPRYNPVLVHESESYEQALYSDFMKIVGGT